MRTALYVGFTVLCLVSSSAAAIAKGKPQHAAAKNQGQVPEQIEQEDERQPRQQIPNAICQPQTPTVAGPQAARTTSLRSGQARANLVRSNKGGRLRGKARAQYVHQLNALKKQGHVPNSLAQQGLCNHAPIQP